MTHRYRRPQPRAIIAALCMLLLAPASAISPAFAASTVTSYASGSEGTAITGLTIEDFENTSLVPGFSVTFSIWRNSSNVITANPPVTYAGTLPQVWVASVPGFPNNPWDGTRALVNGANHSWAYPFAASIEFTFAPERIKVGVGLSNIQQDANSGNTSHTLFVNGENKGTLESLPGWTSQVFNRNRYLVIEGDAISTVQIVADTHFDGMVCDKLALGELADTARPSTFGRIKTLYR